MTALTFPSNPTVGQQYLSDTGTTWTWDGTKWIVGQLVSAPVVTPPPPPPTPTPTPAPTTVYDPLLNLSFPINPTLGQLYTAPDGIIYKWAGNRWTIYSTVQVTAPVTTNTTSQYVLPKATSTTLGGVIIGNGIDNADGVISVNTASIAGAIETAVTGAVISAVEAAVQVPATASTLGEVKIGSNIDVTTDGTISVPTASNSTLGVVQAGTNVSIDGNGAINVATASNSTLGVIKIGANVSIDGTGTISVATGAGINTLESIPNVNPSGITDGSLLVYNAGASRWNVTTNLAQENWDSGQY